MEKGELRPKWATHRWYRKLPYYRQKVRGGSQKGKSKALGKSPYFLLKSLCVLLTLCSQTESSELNLLHRHNHHRYLVSLGMSWLFRLVEYQRYWIVYYI